MVKRRNFKQRQSKLSEAKLKVILNEWVLNEQTDDFGIDYEARICEELETHNQRVTESSFYIQLKETNRKIGKPYFDISTSDLEFFLGQTLPVALIFYITPKDCFYWLIVQTYVWDNLTISDPLWREKKTKRLYFSNLLENITDLKSSIEDAQKRIVRWKITSLDIGEGIKVKDLSQHRERSLKEYKHASMQQASIDILSGDHEHAQVTLEEIIQSPHKDEYTLFAIFNAAFQYNSINPDNFEKIITLTDDGIILGKKIKENSIVLVLEIMRSQVFMNMLYISTSQALFSKKIMYSQKDCDDLAFFSHVYDQELKELMTKRQSISDDINKNLINLCKHGFSDEFDIGLIILLGIIVFQISRIAPLYPELLEGEEDRKPLISICEERAADTQKPHIKQMMHFRLGTYYYWTKKDKQALSHILLAIKYAKEVEYTAAVREYEELKEKITLKPDPYKITQEPEDFRSVTVQEAKALCTESVEFQGYDLSLDDEKTQIIKSALDDMDPSDFLKNCKYLRVSYCGTSPMGRVLGLPSLGMKLLWCIEKKQSSMADNFQTGYSLFKQRYCLHCDHCSPHDKEWICTISWVEEEMKNPEILTEIDRYYKK